MKIKLIIFNLFMILCIIVSFYIQAIGSSMNNQIGSINIIFSGN
jgi:hypothetical protein